MRKSHDVAFKAKVALEAAKGEKPISQPAGISTYFLLCWYVSFLKRMAEHHLIFVAPIKRNRIVLSGHQWIGVPKGSTLFSLALVSSYTLDMRNQTIGWDGTQPFTRKRRRSDQCDA